MPLRLSDITNRISPDTFVLKPQLLTVESTFGRLRTSMRNGGKRLVLRIAGVISLAALGGVSGSTESPQESRQADLILVEKAKRRMTLFEKGVKLAEYDIVLGKNSVGPKVREGDKATPEGVYLVDRRKPDSTFHRALHISYPNETDLKRAKALGVSPGGDIMIHGTRDLPPWPRWANKISSSVQMWIWGHVGTLGCIGVRNSDMDEIWKTVPVGAKVEIRQ